MNPIYKHAILIEPYNAYQKPAKKRHWMEIAEDEALFYRMMTEANAQVSSQQTQDSSTAAAGAGGVPPLEFFQEQAENAAFSMTPTSGPGPLTVVFTNLTDTPLNDTFLWLFGSGSTTSALVNPPGFTYRNIGSYTATLQETSSTGAKYSTSKTVTVLAPTVTPNFSVNFVTGIAPLNVTFSNSSTTNGPSSALAYNWDLGSGSIKSTAINPTMSYTSPGLYTVSLQSTESYYGISNIITRTSYISASAPSVVSDFSVDTSTGVVPLNVTFSNSSSTNGIGILNYVWDLGSGSITSTDTNPSMSYTSPGVYNVSLQVTESYMGVSTMTTKTSYISASV